MIADLTFSSDDPIIRFIEELFCLLVWAGGIVGGTYLLHFFFSLPVRRAERARLFLDLVDDALRRGQPVEEMIVSLANGRDRSIGVQFHLLAAYIESGLRLNEALEQVPWFLPPQIVAMLQAGEKLGDVKKVLPACRELLRDRPAGVRSAVHYMLLVVLFFSPLFVVVMVLTNVFVIPKFKEVAAGMGIMLWPETMFVFGNTNLLICFAITVSLLLWVAVVAYIGGPGLVRFLRIRGFPFLDWIAWRLPWKRKRLQRTFSAMLAVLLDGGVPEAEAIWLAGDCTANEICSARAARIIAVLQEGSKLQDAIRLFDDSGEFHWRLTNATHARGGFLTALRGWHEALDARAFQQEESTAHVLTSGVVIMNGILVGLIATAMFGILFAMLRAMVAS